MANFPQHSQDPLGLDDYVQELLRAGYLVTPGQAVLRQNSGRGQLLDVHTFEPTEELQKRLEEDGYLLTTAGGDFEITAPKRITFAHDGPMLRGVKAIEKDYDKPRQDIIHAVVTHGDHAVKYTDSGDTLEVGLWGGYDPNPVIINGRETWVRPSALDFDGFLTFNGALIHINDILVEYAIDSAGGGRFRSFNTQIEGVGRVRIEQGKNDARVKAPPHPFWTPLPYQNNGVTVDRHNSGKDGYDGLRIEHPNRTVLIAWLDSIGPADMLLARQLLQLPGEHLEWLGLPFNLPVLNYQRTGKIPKVKLS
ncbi:hypothetical protein HYU16_00910 [Candidatus Woesearchaeota archaeon]|nr:hypothetical protein [Candidatus Woesearchaeota archaeon]